MEHLPQELIDRIVWFAERYPGQDQWYSAIGQFHRVGEPPSQFPRLAILNRLWKEAVETITFRSLAIKSDELNVLQSMVTGNRRKYLASIRFIAILPTYSDEACARRESPNEQHINNEAFSKAIFDLFAVLKEWENDGVQNALYLDLASATSPADLRMYGSGPEQESLRYDIAIVKRKDILWDRWEQSQLHLLHPERLSKLSNIAHLRVEGNGRRRLMAATAPDLAASLPNLKSVQWDFYDCDAGSAYDATNNDSSDSDSDSDYELGESNSSASAKMPGNARKLFADRLNSIQLSTLSSANIVFYHAMPFDQKRTCPSIVPTGFSFDPFSAALRRFSQNLTTVTLNAHLDSTLFWPSSDEQDAMAPYWPNLKSLDIDLIMIAPSGQWYFTGQRPSDHENDDPGPVIIGADNLEHNYSDFRVHPDPDTFDPFLAALAKAIAQMPVLEYFMLTSDLSGETGRLHIEYAAPGKASSVGDESPEDAQYRRVYYACEVGKVWVPEQETAEGLRNAGKEKFGGEVIERYVGSIYR
ncbi:hypothetical protein FB567DRAFT_529042 [Paraphoma chrysanthemicola]|uniref:Uncharacterized protein n=1 Tax=Paraphoma chrysanthemicola TaxID=798071 RepID=A0A8K0VXR7_9PLEO|nr:hypothetical protein FB567DRAFT_529042 [Paraphoma chrysanthemicola]